jgi:predicted DNA-binding transcriptional regulator AlpA
MMTPRPLLTAADCAELLGVKRRQAQRLAERADFPKPYAVTPSGLKLWRPDDVQRYANAPRRVGRPATN